MQIEIRGLEAVQAKLGRPLAPALVPAFMAIGEEIRAELAVYPGPSEWPVIWASDEQRKAYFAQRNEFGLDPEYVRNSDLMSERLGPSWATEIRGFGAAVGTTVSYAPYVQNDELQQLQHFATGWVTDVEAAEAVIDSGAIEEHIGRAVRLALGE